MFFSTTWRIVLILEKHRIKINSKSEPTMSKEKMPITPAIRVLRREQALFTEHLYEYVERGGTAVSARELGVAEHAVIKTLVMEDERRHPLLVLMHGDREVSTKELARLLKVKTIAPCTPETATRHSGYLVGGTSPFGTRKNMPVYMEQTILDLPKIYINGGKRGYLVGLDPHELIRILKPVLVKVGIR
jgi:Cys-tRNA(Pro) deacylase